MTTEALSLINPTLVTADGAYPFALETADALQQQREREAVLKGIGELDDDQHAAVLRRQLQLARKLAHPVPLKFVIEQLQVRLETRKLANDLVWYVPFLVLFIIVFLAGRDIEGAFWVGASLAGQVGEGQCPTRESMRSLRPGEVEAYHVSLTLMEVKTIEEWHHWFETQVVQFFYADGFAPDAPSAENNWMAGFNLKLGALRIRTLRVRSDSCSIPTELLNVNGRDDTCFGPFAADRINKTQYGSFPYLSCPHRLLVIQGAVATYPCGGNVFEMSWNLGQEDALTTARSINEIFSNTTDILNLRDMRFIAVEFLTYHPLLDEFAIVRGYTEITPGGGMVHTAQNYAFQVWSASRAYLDVLWILLYLFVFAFVGFYFLDLVTSVRDGAALKWFLSGWNLLELLNLIAFLIIFAFRIAWWVESARLDFVLPGAATYDDRFEKVEWLFRVQVFGGAFNVVLTFLKTLKYVELNPQLAVVTNTLAAAAQNLVGILVIFIVVLTAYSLAAVSLFSSGLADFRDFGTAFSTLLRVLLGDFDYPPMREENRYLAGIFFWSYVVLALFMLLNFFVGVIASSFESESERAKTEPLHETIDAALGQIRSTLNEFWEAPKKFVQDFLETRRSKYAETGRLKTLLQTFQAHREALPTEASSDELELMNEEERENALANPNITFHDIANIFQLAYDAEGADRYVYVGASYCQKIWLDVVRHFEIHEGDSEAAAAEALKLHIQQSTEEALRFVLGTATSSEHRTTKEMLEVQELFAPKAVTLKRIAAMSAAVGKLEEHVASLIHAASKLDSKYKA